MDPDQQPVDIERCRLHIEFIKPNVSLQRYVLACWQYAFMNEEQLRHFGSLIHGNRVNFHAYHRAITDTLLTITFNPN